MKFVVFSSKTFYAQYLSVIYGIQIIYILTLQNQFIIDIMQVFRKKYLYNPENPIYSSENVKTYNCLNTETKDNRLALIHHLHEPPFVQPSPGTLQPIEIPSLSEPFSVYPLVYCCSEIGKISQPEAMYVIKCLLECKLKNPLYYVLSPQGICGSQIEGLLPSKSPSIFNIALDMLDISENLVPVEKSVLSPEGYRICKSIRDGENVLNSLSQYGWKDIKKQKDNPKDKQFWIFKGRRKQEGSFGEQYGLAWNAKNGLCRFKYYDLSKDAYQPEFYKDFADKMTYFQQNNNPKINLIKIHKVSKEGSGIKIFTQIPNQGTLSQYITKKHDHSLTINERNFIPQLQGFIQTMKLITNQGKIKGHGALHIKNVFVHNNKVILGQPFLITEKIEKKLRQVRNSLDYYSPEFKENVVLPQNLFKLDAQKIDIWAFGFILNKLFVRQIPMFDPTRKPLLAKQKLSQGMHDLIMRCLSLTPSLRPSWSEISIKDVSRHAILIEDVQQAPLERQEIRLGSKKQKMRITQTKKFKINQQDIILEHKSQKKDQYMFEQEADKLKQEEPQQVKYVNPLPVQLSSRLKKIKLVAKIVVVILLYVFVFFRPFLGGSMNILFQRSYYTTASLHLINYNNEKLSTTTVITHDPKFFLINDISFTDVQNTYKCIPNNFDSVANPDYSLLSYIQSGSFLALLLTGWLCAIIICVTKGISIWQGGLSSRPTKSLIRHLIVYVFFELIMASLLFAHFYIYQFFYYADSSPCLNIQSFDGLQPYFDSSLYLMVQNQSGYLQKIFATLGILSVLLLISACFYAWAPKMDAKHFLHVVSIIFRYIPYILLFLLCRIGVFSIFSPTAINDSTSILPAIIIGSATGFFGIIPQIFILICIIAQLLLQVFFFFCQRKAAQNDRMAKLFNIKKKKVLNDLGEGEGEQDPNNMSMLNNSKAHLQVSNIE